MKRILVLGSSGVGKSSFARKLHKKLNIRLINLDEHYWKPNWEKPTTEDWEEKIQELIQEESWIMDGNYRSTLYLRFPVADTIILLDLPWWICMYRVIKRQIRKNRIDEIPGCKEIIRWNLLRWVIWKYPRIARKDILQKLEALKSKKRVIILQSRREIEEFLSNPLE